MNEVNGYKQAVMSYYASKGKLPGDRKNLGKIGIDSGNDGEFEDIGEVDYAEGWLPFYDMDKEGILDFDEEKDHLGSDIGKESNILKNTLYYFLYLDRYKGNSNIKGLHESVMNKNYLILQGKYDSYIPTKMMSSIDQKMDDGEAFNGKIIGFCTDFEPDLTDYTLMDQHYGGFSYTESIDNKGVCGEAFFLLDI